MRFGVLAWLVFCVLAACNGNSGGAHTVCGGHRVEEIGTRGLLNTPSQVSAPGRQRNEQLTIADVNNDGRDDIVVGALELVSVFLQTVPRATFAPGPSIVSSDSIIAMD